MHYYAEADEVGGVAGEYVVSTTAESKGREHVLYLERFPLHATLTIRIGNICQPDSCSTHQILNTWDGAKWRVNDVLETVVRVVVAVVVAVVVVVGVVFCSLNGCMACLTNITRHSK